MSNPRHTAIITGAASGLGRALAVGLARNGWQLALCDVNDVGSRETARLVEQAGGAAQVEHLDVTRFEAWQELSGRLRTQWPQLDLLVNNAGVAGAGDVGDYSIADWQWIMDVNLWNGIYGCHTFIDWLKANPRGAHIINTASLAAIGSAPSMAAYNVTKAGMLALSETLYAELMPHNVGVTVLCPAFFPTNLLNDGRFRQESMKRMATKAFEQARFTADDVAAAALRAMRRKQLYVVMPAQGRFYWYFKRFAPQRFLRTVGRQFAQRVAKTKAPA